MEWVLHVLGLCPDSFSHPSILQELFVGASGWFGLKYLWHRIRHRGCDIKHEHHHDDKKP